jgi:hypothetical protein
MAYEVIVNNSPNKDFYDYKRYLPFVLSDEELLEVFKDKNKENLFIGGNVDYKTKKVTLCTGDFRFIMVPFSIFEPCANGISPDFNKVSIIDYGQTVTLGKYEISNDFILKEGKHANNQL